MIEPPRRVLLRGGFFVCGNLRALIFGAAGDPPALGEAQPHTIVPHPRFDPRPKFNPRRRLRYASLTLASLTDGYQLGHASIEACRP